MSTPLAGAADSPPPSAGSPLDAGVTPYQRPAASELLAQWSRLTGRVSALLRAPEATSFKATLAAIDAELQGLADHDGDRVIFVARFLAESEVHRYCAAHSLYVALACHLAAQAIDGFDERRRAQLRGAALTMNIAMAALQDQLARQDTPLNAGQREAIDDHEARGAALLGELGIDDAHWMQAVAQHHRIGAGALDARSPAEQMARLIQRADRLTAAHSVRAGRPARAAGDASRTVYLDEAQQPDEAGSALIKALGIYPPGSLVQLASAEIAIVMQRGERADQPRVAVVVRDDGMPHLSPRLHAATLPAMKIVGSLAQQGTNVRLSLEALLKLVP